MLQKGNRICRAAETGWGWSEGEGGEISECCFVLFVFFKCYHWSRCLGMQYEPITHSRIINERHKQQSPIQMYCYSKAKYSKMEIDLHYYLFLLHLFKSKHTRCREGGCQRRGGNGQKKQQVAPSFQRKHVKFPVIIIKLCVREDWYSEQWTVSLRFFAKAARISSSENPGCGTVLDFHPDNFWTIFHLIGRGRKVQSSRKMSRRSYLG